MNYITEKVVNAEETVKMITCDRGGEFSEWRRIEKELEGKGSPIVWIILIVLIICAATVVVIVLLN